jgi:hypothetical protein
MAMVRGFPDFGGPKMSAGPTWTSASTTLIRRSTI